MTILKFDVTKPASLLSILISLTLISIAGQVAFFVIHYNVSELLDSLVQSSLKSEMFHLSILLPIAGYLLVQLISYCLFVAWTWFLTISISELFKLTRRIAFWLCIFVWLMSCLTVLSLNNYYYPDSFFASLIRQQGFLNHTPIILSVSLCCMGTAAFLAYLNLLLKKHHLYTGSGFLILLFAFTGFSIYDSMQSRAVYHTSDFITYPNIILIGIDSVRPDYTGYFGNKTISTPNIDAFLKSSTVFTETYTPLARTFPSWTSILTAKYPKHNHARSNLAWPDPILANEMLAKRLKLVGYETFYATDEKRFSNITERYGFDHIIGPDMGVNDFILGGLADFPLTNLVINTSLGRVLFPFNYANRAAAITYEPDAFLQLVKLGLAKRSNKPQFLAIHLCISHWPYTWARDKQEANFSLTQKYKSSVEAVDEQLGALLLILRENGLLNNSLVVLLSDHGTTTGVLGDRIIDEKHYLGDRSKLKNIPKYKIGTAPSYSFNFRKDYTLNTSYGQGTDILSLKQYHVLLAFRGFGVKTYAQQFHDRTALFDIAPTVLEFLQLPPMKNVDGISLNSYLSNKTHKNIDSRPLFIETGYSISDIQTNDIKVENVIKQSIGAYQINPRNAQLSVRPGSEKTVNASKQRAILLGDWLLARYPVASQVKLVPLDSKNTSSSRLAMKSYIRPEFYVIANLKTHQWGVGLDSPVARQAPMAMLLREFNKFYGDEIKA